GALSGGMKQKLGLACALIRKPRLLLLDEPSVGVDPISRRELWKMVYELVDQGIGVIWSTAYLDEAERCRAVLVLSEGKLLFDGAPSLLTSSVEGRTVLVQGIERDKRIVLTRALDRPEFIDGVIQGASVRLLLAENAAIPPVETLQAGPTARIEATGPRFEDALMARLGARSRGQLALANARNKATSSDELMVEADQLTKKFGDFVAADRISFSIRRGEVYGLIGPNGAGKSTTFKMLCGLLQPSSGAARVAGVDLATSPGRARSRLGYMAQKFSLYGDLSVAQNLKFFGGVYGLDRRALADVSARMAETLNLTAYLDHTAARLPLGYKQRLALACSLLHDPDVLFLDEPTSGVDPRARREFWTHINALASRGVTILVTTHFLEEAEYCDRIALIYRGRAIADGTPDELKAKAGIAGAPALSLEDAFINLVHEFDQERAA
ncbi:MAG: ATP-binding cassette domain-containing protein, partial [Amphiplicatus sp.]|nr:ATP-binding cassette domain-containing protein [Amphiplicatus sp.]